MIEILYVIIVDVSCLFKARAALSTRIATGDIFLLLEN